MSVHNEPSIEDIIKEINHLRNRVSTLEARVGPTKEEARKQRSIAAGLRFDVLRRDGFRCTYCGVQGTRRSLRVDHVVPIASGGKSTMSNLTTACEPCNAGKSDKILDETVTPSYESEWTSPRPAPRIKNTEPVLSAEEMHVAAAKILDMLNGYTPKERL